jgi:serine protease Do
MHRITFVLAALLVAGNAALAQPDPPAPPAPPRSPRVRVAVSGSPTSFLGVGVTDVDAERAKALNLKEEHGVEVTSVDADSPASKAGVKVSDVVLEYNGQRVEGIEQFLRLVRETPVGRQVKLLISRGGANQTLTATTGSRSARDFVWSGDELRFRMPEVHIPDMPRMLTMWQSRVLGVESESLNSQLGEFFGAKEGVLVRAVIKGSAAEKAGLKAGDVITKIGARKVTSPNDVSSALRSLSSTKGFPVTIVRERKETTVSVTIEDKSSERIRGTLVRYDL